MKSMTGFGRASSSENGRDVTVEIKSVNSRFLDLSFRLPRTFQAMELKIRQIVKGSISRGKVEVFLSVEDRAERDKKLLVNKVLAERYKTEITELSKSLGLPCSLNAERIFFYPEVFRLAEEEMEEDEEALIAVVKKAVEEFVYSRSEEGKKLRADLEEKLSEMQGYIAFFKEREPEIRLQYEKRLRRKIEDCLEGRNIDEGRILEEVAIFSDKVSTDEEITRLDSHVKRAGALVKEEEAVGRDLDFLMQEMNRESNTILSKATDLEITNIALKAKNCIEKMREQIQNIE
jgi:TIGR00255 family protein